MDKNHSLVQSKVLEVLDSTYEKATNAQLIGLDSAQLVSGCSLKQEQQVRLMPLKPFLSLADSLQAH